MSKNCGHTVPCGCKDIPLTTGAPCNDGIECEGNPCAENFCAECIIWCGDGLPQLGIETGMTLQHVIQRIEVALAPILPHNCAEITDPPSCNAPLLGTAVATNTTIDLSWLDGGSNQQYVVNYGPLSTGVFTTLAPQTTNTVVLTALIPDTNYLVYVEGQCVDLGTACKSSVILVKTLNT
jgi:hypothetical protein